MASVPGVVIPSVLKEPLLHFLLAGAVLFGAYAWMNSAAQNPPAGQGQEIRIGVGDVQWLAENWTTQWRRQPTYEELGGLIEDYVNEQLLAREARALGLEDNDVIVRRRLAQKLTFLIDGTLRRAEPSETELQQFYDAHAQRFRSDARISFTHIYFSAERADARSDATNALRVLLETDAALPAGQQGDRFLIENDFRDESERFIASTFGPEFARAVSSLRTGVWSGPIQSGYGQHLVRVATLREGQLPPLAEVRERVLEDWRSAQEKTAKDRFLNELRKKYDIVADAAIDPLILRKATVRMADQ